MKILHGLNEPDIANTSTALTQLGRVDMDGARAFKIYVLTKHFRSFGDVGQGGFFQQKKNFQPLDKLFR